MPEKIIEHEEIKIISIRPIYTLGRSPSITIQYRLKQDSMKIRPGDVLTLIKNPARQGETDGV